MVWYSPLVNNLYEGGKKNIGEKITREVKRILERILLYSPIIIFPPYHISPLVGMVIRIRGRKEEYWGGNDYE